MTLPNPGAWQAVIEENAPQLYQDVTSVREHVLSEGALPLKVKVMMTML